MLRILVSLMLALLGCEMYAREITVTSYNIRYDAAADRGPRDWQQRHVAISSFLLGYEIIGLQEALSHQRDVLAQALPHHQVLGVGRDDGARSGEQCPILFDKRHWSLDPQQHGTFWLSSTPQKAGSMSWGNALPRICTWARLVDSHEAGLYVYNCHWDHRSQHSRLMAAKLMANHLNDRRYIDEPVILLGDLNATVDNPAVQILLGTPDIRKRRLLVDHGPAIQTYNHWQPNLHEGMRIDHIFCSPFLPVTRIQVHSHGDPPASDHHPVSATIHWDGAAQQEALTLRYLQESLLGKEHGSGAGLIVRWAGPTNVRAIGATPEQLRLLVSVLDEINLALQETPMRYQLTSKASPQELRVYFTDSSQIQALGKKEGYTIPKNADGFAGQTWNSATKLILHASVFIDTDKSKGEFMRHVILEEVTQTLGLMGDNAVFPESVSYSRGRDQGSAKSLSNIDKNALVLLYQHLKAGYTSLEVGVAFGRFWPTNAPAPTPQ